MKGETPRLVLDFAGMTHSTGVNPLTVVNGALVQRIRVGVHPGEGGAVERRVECVAHYRGQGPGRAVSGARPRHGAAVAEEEHIGWLEEDWVHWAALGEWVDGPEVR